MRAKDRVDSIRTLKESRVIDILEKTVAKFDADLEGIFGDRYLDTIIYGSVSLGAFTPHRGDIDFVVVTADDLDDGDIDKVFALHDVYRLGGPGLLLHQLEGTYYPRRALEDISCDFSGCYVGTRRKGWRRIGRFGNNVFDLVQFSTNAIRLRRAPLRIHRPDAAEIEAAVEEGTRRYLEYLKDPEFPAYDALHYAARCLFYFERGRIGSKQEACEAYAAAKGGDPAILECGNHKMQDDHGAFETAHPELREIARRALTGLRKCAETGTGSPTRSARAEP